MFFASYLPGSKDHLRDNVFILFHQIVKTSDMFFRHDDNGLKTKKEDLVILSFKSVRSIFSNGLYSRHPRNHRG